MSPSARVDLPPPGDARSGEIRKLSTLLEASQALLRDHNLKDGFQRVLEILHQHHGAIRSTVLLLNENTQDIELSASVGISKSGRWGRYRSGEGITGRVIERANRSSFRK